jgi:hypothetical protein
MAKVIFNVGDQVYVVSIGMTAIVLSRAGDQYRIKRADGKFDYVMSNGLVRCKNESQTQKINEEAAQA